MYEKHFWFEPPDTDSTTIWKYLKFEYFVSLLDKKSLFFAKPKLFEDPYEGSYSNANRAEMNEILEKYDENSIIAQNIRTLLDNSKKTDNAVLNCWHMNKGESAAMWKLYSGDNAGISIKSDFGRLKNCFSECPYTVYIGKINYIDWNLEKIPQNNIFSPYLYKRRSFEHEQEIRALVHLIRHDGEICYIDKNQVLQKHEFINDGIYVPISLDTLIEKIYVSPKSSKWFLDLVKSISKMYGLNKEIISSNLYDGPS